MTIVCPTTQLDSSLASQSAAWAMSTGNPDLPISNPSANQGFTISGVRSNTSADNSPPTGAKIAVATPPGQMALTLIARSASSRATDFVNPKNPKLRGCIGARAVSSGYTGYAGDVYNGSGFHERDSIFDPKKCAEKHHRDRSLESVNWFLRDRSAFTARSGVVNHTIELAELFDDKFINNSVSTRLQRPLGKMPRLGSVLLRELSLFMRATTENHFGTFFGETSDDSFADSSGAAGNDSNFSF
jgi:hypothetical protein